MYDTEVLIVGAGPTGLTLAAGLAQRGVPVRVVDKAERASPHSKAVIMWPLALEALATVGAGQELFDRGVPVLGSTYYTGSRMLGRLAMRPLAGTRFPMAVSLPQSTTEEVLRETVARLGGRVEFGHRLVSLAQDAGGVTAELSNGETVRARRLVGCDGAHSTVRDLSGVPFDGAPYPQTFALVDGEYETDYVHDESYYVLCRTGIIVILGLPGGLYRVFVSVPPGQPVDDPVAAVNAIIAESSPRKLTQTRVAGSGTFQIQRRQARRMRVGRVLLAGDAAHVHSPAGGLGMNMGICDAHSLAWRLAGIGAGTLDESELDQWETERLHVAKRVIRETDQQTQMWMLQGWQRSLRDVAIGVGMQTRLIERFLPRHMAQLDWTLPNQQPGVGGLRPGRRVTDVPLDGDRHLHDLFRTGGHLLLAFGADLDRALAPLDLPAAPGPGTLRMLLVAEAAGYKRDGADVVTDPTGHLRQALSAPREALCLIRPDGVIEAAADPADAVGVSRLRARVRTLTQPRLTEGAGR